MILREEYANYLLFPSLATSYTLHMYIAVKICLFILWKQRILANRTSCCVASSFRPRSISKSGWNCRICHRSSLHSSHFIRDATSTCTEITKYDYSWAHIPSEIYNLDVFVRVWWIIAKKFWQAAMTTSLWCFNTFHLLWKNRPFAIIKLLWLSRFF